MRKIVSIFSCAMLFLSCSKISDQTVIQIWHQMAYENRQIFREICDKYELDHPEIKIQLTYRETEELRSTFQAVAMGGSGPELIYYPSDQVGTLVRMNLILPLDSLFSGEYFNQFSDEAIVEFSGKKWMVGDMIGNNLMLIYNTDLLKSPPQTTDELISIGKQHTLDLDENGSMDRYGLVWNFTEPFFYVPWLGGFGEWMMKNETEPNLNTLANVRAFSFIKSLKDDHQIIPKECDYETANALFKTGKAAMIINGDWSLGDYEGVVNYDIAPLPMVSATGLWPTPTVSTKGFSINKNVSKEKLHYTTMLMSYLTSDSVQIAYSKRLKVIPSSLAAVNELSKSGNPHIKKLSDIAAMGRSMPVVPEIRAIWDALRTEYQSVLGGTLSPEDAALNSQMEAEKQIKIMNEVIQPGIQAKIIKIVLPVSLLFIVFLLRQKFRQFFTDIKLNPTAYWFYFPAMAVIFLVVIFPFFYNVMISLSNFSLNKFENWQIVGFNHYLSVFGDMQIFTVFLKTIIWTLINIVFHVSIGIFLAVLINQTIPAKGLLRTLLIIPWAIPQYISALTWRGMFNQEYGSFNLALKYFFNMDSIQWLSQPVEAFSACILTNIWLGFPFMMVIALGGLQSIPVELYEAARVDGASRWQQFWKITLPMLKPVMVPAIILGVIWTFNNINVVWLVSNGGEPSNQTHILVSFVYKAAFNLYRYGYSAALSMVIFLILFFFGWKMLDMTNAFKRVKE